MAVIQKIRNKYGKLAGGIIALALVGFIFMDAASGRFGDLFGHDSSVVKVNGEKIDQKTYQERIKEYETLYSMFNKNNNIDDELRARIDDQALHLAEYEIAAGEQCDKLGIKTTDEEKKDLIYGANPDPMVMQFQSMGNKWFNNPQTGQFDPQYVKAFEQQAPQNPQYAKAVEEWEIMKAYILRSNRYSKFNSLFTVSVYTPRYLIERNAKEQLAMANVSLIKIPFTTINDNEVKVTDDDIKAYMEKHAALYSEDQASRSIEYVPFDIKPSKEDTDRTVNALLQIKTNFANAKDDAAFVNTNSDNPVAPSYQNKRSFKSAFADSILNMPVGTVYGPYFENNSYKITKVADKKEYPDSVKLRQILVITKSGSNDVLPDSIAKKRIDSIATAIQAGASFDTLAQKYSDDPGSKNNKGEYTFSVEQKEGLAKEFGDFIFDGKTGDKKVVKVTNDNYSGYHYIEILSQTGAQPAVELATVNKALFAGDNTVNAAYAKATEFAGKNSTGDAFDETVKKENLNERLVEDVKENDFSIRGLVPAREIIKWMYHAKTGEVSPVFTVGSNLYVVAKLSSIQDKGLIPITADNRPMLAARVKADKKADLLAAKYKGMSSLNAIASASNQPVQNADSIKLGSQFIPVIGYAPKLVGYTFYNGLQINALSPAIKSPDGIFFITVQNRWTVTPDQKTIQMMMYQQAQQMEMQARNTAGELLQETITKSADIKYNVDNF